LGFPKERDFYARTRVLHHNHVLWGNGVLVVGNRLGSPSITKVRQQFLSTSTSANNDKYITGKVWLSKLRVREGKYLDLYKLICTEEFLFGCYYSIKSNPGNMNPGIDNETFDGISKEYISKLAKSLKDESFKFKPARRIFIPKRNGQLRPLGIPSPRDKIVQKAMALVLSLIYEPIFSDLSHGFRPNRSTHTALREIHQ
jgi:retron-type reverse transcriptase